MQTAKPFDFFDKQQPPLAHRLSTAFPFSLPPATMLLLKVPESRHIPRRSAPAKYPVNAPASWNVVALHGFSLPHRLTAHSFPPERGAWLPELQSENRQFFLAERVTRLPRPPCAPSSPFIGTR